MTNGETKRCIREFKPEGFEYEKGKGGLICSPLPAAFFTEKLLSQNPVFYPLFLQRVIEGINKQYYDNIQDRYFIEIGCESVNIWDDADNTICFFGQYESFDNIDQAKEKAIQYILEHTDEVK